MVTSTNATDSKLTFASRDASGADEDEVITRAKLDEATRQLWEKVEVEIQTFRVALQSISNGVDIEVLAAATAPRSEAPQLPVALTDLSTVMTCKSPKEDVHDITGETDAIPSDGSCFFDDMNYEHEIESNPSNSHAAPQKVVTHAEVRDELIQQARFHWTSTLWDACTFLGTPALGLGGSMLIFILTVAAISVQAVYCVIIEELLVPNTMSEETVEGLRNWRVKVAHSVRYMDEVSGTSLAARVCSNDPALEMSAEQHEMVRSIEDFLPQGRVVNGPNVCMMAIFSFLTVILIELRRTTAWVTSLYELVSPGHTHISLDAEAGKKLKLHSISRIRFILILLLALIRTVIAVWLGAVSVRYLMYTTSVERLFLMAMKFIFVLNVDELLFQSLASQFIKVMISEMKPLVAPHHQLTYVGCDRTSIVCLVLTVGVLVVANATAVDDVKERLQVLQSAVCGGNKDFVYAVNPTDGSIEWAVTKELRLQEEPYRWSAITELQWLTDNLSALSLDVPPKLSRRTTVNRVVALRSMAMGEEAADTFVMCVDRLEHYNQTDPNKYAMTQAILSAKVGIEVTSCQNISVANCGDFSASQVRALCPVQCGCGDLTSGFFLNSAHFGCNVACYADFRLKNYMRATKCVDMTKAELRENSAWTRYWDGYEKFNSFIIEAREQITRVGPQIAFEHGCSVIRLARGTGVDFCEGYEGNIIPLTAFCPETCGCAESNSRFCPPSCAVGFQSGNFKFNCISVPEPSDDVGVACEIVIMGSVVYTMGLVDGLCCKVINRLIGEYMTRSNVSQSTLRDLCCMEGCIDEIEKDSSIDHWFTGVDLGRQSCYA